MKRKYITILGGGESGVGAALLANKNNLKVFVSDSGIIKNKYKKILIKNDILFEENGHTENFIINESIKIIKSPGIYKNNYLINRINLMKIPIISELDFCMKYIKEYNYLIGITGSNGKTTTSSILYNILKKNKCNVGLAGNIGFSFSRKILEKKNIYVLEISSFQLDDSYKFHANIAILLNITNDHLDRYENNIEKYMISKFRLTNNQTKKDIFIYNYDDPMIRIGLKKFFLNIKSNFIPFSAKRKLKFGFYIEKNIICYQDKNNKIHKIFNVKYIYGLYNIYNIIAIIIVSKLLNINNNVLNSVLSNLNSIEHRLEKINYIINGVNFINDSKATNVSSTFFALEKIKGPIIWIVGGKDKGNNYKELVPIVKKKVKAIICLGIDNIKIINMFKNIVHIILETKSMKKAVYISYSLSKPGYNILLSPSCSSFDLFDNYIKKGNEFKKEVKYLFYNRKNEKNKYFY
ncbi:UDP-N-acetylmuramoyl-L-alanine--D-glutamate ligase [Blattabacterium cuenoti]|uniref:UDP-N-acetylmuramoyl-L-alanine--D-glutamate ligase n=1 Tax=Blattabacterium cuenoti TaxID=1653831 RepID=UPI00163B842F|nr:UDP-N-acetylmuramoyl-L-alanine--D-glutamate ligase [Blattabacterium cuenoti]